MSQGADGGLSYASAAILGLVQGLTEFLPVSSKGHLVLTERLLGVRVSGIGVEVALHIGTLVAVVLYYAKDLLAVSRALPAALGALARGRLPSDAPGRLLLGLVLGTLPAVLIVIAFGDQIEAHFHSIRIALAGFVLTGVVLWTTRRGRGQRDEATLRDALLIGAAQGAAVLPGVSRSGSTIGAAVALGLSREGAARFSFLLSIPAVLGAIAHSAGDIVRGDSGVAFGGPLLLGILVSFVVGLLSIHLLLGIARRNRLDMFSWYLWTVALAGFVFLR